MPILSSIFLNRILKGHYQWILKCLKTPHTHTATPQSILILQSYTYSSPSNAIIKLINIQLMQKFIFTLKRKCLRWSGPLSWTNRNSGGCHLLLLHISIKADTGCLPAEKKKIVISTICGNKLWIHGEGEQEEIQVYPSPDRSFIAAEKFPDLFCALSPTATRPLKKTVNVHWINFKDRFKL